MLSSFLRKAFWGLGIVFTSMSSLSAQTPTATNACSAISLGALAPLNGFVPSANDAWHQDISAAPLDPNSNKIITTPGDLANRHLHPDFSSIAGGNAGIPYIVVDSSTAPVPFTNLMYNDDSDIAWYPLSADLPIEGTPGDCPSDTNDRHAIILDRSSCVIYEVFQAASCKASTPIWSASNGAMWDMLSTEKRPYGVTSVDAAGLSVFEGLVRYDEIAAGNINHALRFTANHTKDNANNGYFVAPATHAAGSLWGTDNIMGMRIRLRADFDVSGFSTTNQIILKAMKQYGMILADNGSDMFFQGTPDARWDDDDLSKLKAVPSSAFDVIKMDTMYDSETAPKGAAPTIASFSASPSVILKGQSVTLTSISDGSYSYIDQAGFTRGLITVYPTATTTYTLTSRNAYGTTTASTTVTVQTTAPPVITFAPIADKSVIDLSFTVSATSNSTGAITYSVLSGPAIVLGNLVTLTGVGNVTLQASQAAAGTYTEGASTITFAVKGLIPALAFNPISDQVATAAPFPVSVTSDSQGALSYSGVSGPATIAGNIVTLTGTGRVTLLASQAALGNFLSTSASTSFNVSSAVSSLTLSPVPDQTIGSGPITISASSNSPVAITYSILSGPATIAGNVVTVTAPGAVIVQASQTASGVYAAATAVVTFTVKSSVPALSFTPVADQMFSSTPFAVTAASNSQGAISYAVLSGPATIAGNMVTLNGAGRVTISANQAAWGTYAAGSATLSFTVTAYSTNLVIAPIPDQTIGSGPITVSASSNSPVAITFSILSGPATVVGNMVTFTAPGAVIVQASQTASGSYAVATAVVTFTVKSIVPALSFSPVADQMFSSTPFAITAASNSQGAITYAVLGGPATIASNMVTLNGAGRVTISASQAAWGAYAAGSATVSFTVTAYSTNLVIAPIPDQTAGGGPITISASSNSPASITYVVLSGPARVAGNVVTYLAPGTVVLQGSQSASSGFSLATATTNFTVKALPAGLSVASIPTQINGVGPLPLSATSLSPGALTWSVLSGPATLAGNTVTPVGAGLVMLQVQQAASGNYANAVAVSTFTIQDFAFTQMPSLSLQQGSKTTGAISLGSLSGFAGQVDLSCNIPSDMTGAACSVTNVDLASNSANAQSTITVSSVHNYYAANGRGPLASPWAKTAALALLLLPVGFSRRRRIPALVAAFLFSMAALGVTGCGVGAPTPTAPGTYTLQIVGTSGTASHSGTVQVVVQ